MVTIRCPNCQWVRLAGTPARASEMITEHLRTHIVNVPVTESGHEQSREDAMGERSGDE